MKRDPKPSELLEITAAAQRGDRLSAISLYISATEAGLTEAQDFVRKLTATVQEPVVQATKTGAAKAD
jgi:ribosomal protein L7/L12